MHTMADQIYPQRFQQVEAIVQAIQRKDLAEADRLLADNMTHLSLITSKPEQLQVELFLQALATRIKPSAAQASNLYLMPDQGQQIRMFNFMANKFPVVTLAQQIANMHLLRPVAHAPRFTLLDIGMGTGQQAEQMLRHARTSGLPVQQVHIIGIEPSAESMAKADARFTALADELGMAISLLAVEKTVEQMDVRDWRAIEQVVAGAEAPLLLNASFALHHVRPDCRKPLLDRLKAMRPAVFMLIEPYGDYTTENVLERFRNAWHHYGLTFQAIDAIDAPDEDKSNLKRVFFGRELPDVLAESARVEQYETAEMWLDRLTSAGFAPFSVNLPQIEMLPPGVELIAYPDYLGFNVNGYPIVAVMGVQ